MRYQVSNREAAACASAYLGDYDEETGKLYARVKLEREDSYTVTDGDRTYLTHLTKPGKSVFDLEDEKIPKGTDILELA